MKQIKEIIVFLLIISFTCSCNAQNKKVSAEHKNNPYYSRTDTNILNVSDQEWEKILPKEVYEIARDKGTEYAFSGKYWNSDAKGTYYCAVCGNPLFRSDAKFASSCGWPSFFEALRPNSVIYAADGSQNV